MSRTAPATLHCRPLPWGRVACDWHCADPPVPAVKFIDRRNPRWIAVLHRSTRLPGGWQLSRFYDGDPMGHSERQTCNTALKYGLDSGRRWRLAKKGE